MIAGRLRFGHGRRKRRGGITLAVFEFGNGRLAFTEAGTKRRASLHCVRGETALDAFAMGGLEVMDADAKSFAARLRSENHTLKRALTDPRLISGIGNAYSDEILHRARLSPLALTAKLRDDEMVRLFEASRDVLREWTMRLRAEAGNKFPERVTAFRPGWRYRTFGCPVRYAPARATHRLRQNECNYSARRRRRESSPIGACAVPSKLA
jgi:formamidopyrimidine-DNA glycosylase